MINDKSRESIAMGVRVVLRVNKRRCGTTPWREVSSLSRGHPHSTLQRRVALVGIQHIDAFNFGVKRIY